MVTTSTVPSRTPPPRPTPLATGTHSRFVAATRTPVGASPPSMMTAPTPPSRTVFVTALPRIGGILPDEGPGEAWTGGSNITPSIMPMSLTQRRPWKYASAKGLEDDIKKGTKDKLGLDEEESDCSFQLWLKQVHHGHVVYGMDTIFLMPNADWTRETNLFFDHTLDMEKVKPWNDQLLIGVINKKNSPPVQHPPCSYDYQNLTLSREYLLASVTNKFIQKIMHSVGLQATGLQVFY